MQIMDLHDPIYSKYQGLYFRNIEIVGYPFHKYPPSFRATTAKYVETPIYRLLRRQSYRPSSNL
ncbi:hypothetical protein U771_04865 [Pseudomonas gorinensis]|uniref:Uncharacterized protein n=1 Tax=Pseudomonas gorinensis TaxID=3240790 RepID=A0ACA7P0Z5_9PSED|nr:hypothetical protein U771_04865 [Pseudomonas sp. TKP]